MKDKIKLVMIKCDSMEDAITTSVNITKELCNCKLWEEAKLDVEVEDTGVVSILLNHECNPMDIPKFKLQIGVVNDGIFAN